VFVQATTSARQNGKTYVSYLVRESFRTPQGPRSRTICNITDLPAPTRELIIASLNHVRLCFLAYWLSARLGCEWRAKGETEEVPRVLRHLQTIRVGRLQLGQKIHRTLMTDIPRTLNEQLQKLGLAPLFAAPPKP
jgi:hypothetical protein